MERGNRRRQADNLTVEQADSSIASVDSLDEEYLDDNDHRSVHLPTSMNFYERIRLSRETVLEKYPLSYQPIISYWHAAVSAAYGDEQISEPER